MYDYSVYKQTKGKAFADSVVTRNTYFVADSTVPGEYSVGARYYHHSSTLNAPLLYCSTGATVPASHNNNGTYSINLYSGSAHYVVSSMNITPDEVTVCNDLTIPNDVYIGSDKEWKIHVDLSRKALVFQRKSDSTGLYVTQFEIQQET